MLGSGKRQLSVSPTDQRYGLFTQWGLYISHGRRGKELPCATFSPALTPPHLSPPFLIHPIENPAQVWAILTLIFPPILTPPLAFKTLRAEQSKLETCSEMNLFHHESLSIFKDESQFFPAIFLSFLKSRGRRFLLQLSVPPTPSRSPVLPPTLQLRCFRATLPAHIW